MAPPDIAGAAERDMPLLVGALVTAIASDQTPAELKKAAVAAAEETQDDAKG